MDEDSRQYVYQSLNRPSIGTVVELCRTLDIESKYLGNSNINQSLNKYPHIRNEFIGHGYVFKDGVKELCSQLNELSHILAKHIRILSQEYDLISVQKLTDKGYKGINYRNDGQKVTAWFYPKSDNNALKSDSLYLVDKFDDFHRLSPFILISNFGKNIYVFSSVDEYLTGRVRYNRLLETDKFSLDCKEFENVSMSNDGLKNKSINGTIRNVYRNNFKKYIDTGLKKDIVSFLKKNESSNSATIWGHGGVGKTATIQSIADDLSAEHEKHFEYIIFVSAKDRKYDYIKGSITEIEDNISTYIELVEIINQVVFGVSNMDINRILAYDGKMLIIIDDFETFSFEEKENIKSFTKQLSINHFKIIITTRSNTTIGIQFQTNELSIQKTTEFLKQTLDNEGIPLGLISTQRIDGNKKKIHNITSGRPLFIYQLAYVIAKKDLETALSYDINSTKAAIEFLYGRIYNYLSDTSQDLFIVMSALVTEKDLSNVISKVQYALNLDSDIKHFNESLDELIKLKVIEIDDDRKIFTIYSTDILIIMKSYFEKRSSSFKGNVMQRIAQVNQDKDVDIEYSLLKTAHNNRLTRNEVTVIDSYKQILNRATASKTIKLEAILALTAYLNEKGLRREALDIFELHNPKFIVITQSSRADKVEYANYTKMWATYSYGGGTFKEKRKAVNILGNYISVGINYDENIDLELAGLLLQYRSWLYIANKQENLSRLQFKEINKGEFSKVKAELIKECKAIFHRHGNHLVQKVMQIKLSDVSSAARQNIVIAFYNYVEVLVDLNKFQEALSICDYVLDYGPQHFSAQFNRKKSHVAKRMKHKRPSIKKRPRR
ncbi:NB-ARC domain-containing protein [Lewinella sp. IMCC34183]|uniref:NB-ARC domain-containing protein n=1 Tax=Lewinella sp. IMCC34183 TaxID=2248762 RepID=UPI0013005E68|nr:NB-ARC domain-containing protein [Lewinella sp. IMCC34183]